MTKTESFFLIFCYLKSIITSCSSKNGTFYMVLIIKECKLGTHGPQESELEWESARECGFGMGESGPQNVDWTGEHIINNTCKGCEMLIYGAMKTMMMIFII